MRAEAERGELVVEIAQNDAANEITFIESSNGKRTTVIGKSARRPAKRIWTRSNEVTPWRTSDSFRMRIGSFRMFTAGCDL